MMKKRLILIVMMLLAALLLTGCAKEEEKTASLYVNVIDTFVFDESREALDKELPDALPALNTTEAPLSVVAISSGDTEKDPMGAMAGMTQIAGLMATGEMELILADAENARRHGDNGGSYIPLDELFTKEEQTVLGIVPLCIPVSNDDGEFTGEMSIPCGIDLSGCVRLTEMLHSTDVGAYVLVSSKHVDNAKTVIQHLLTMK